MLNENKNINFTQRQIYTYFIIIFLLINLGLLGIIVRGSVNEQPLDTTLSRGSPRGLFISKNTNWTLTNSPYVITENVLVEKGATLKIEPGVVVKFDGNYYIQVEGALAANGTSDKMITFNGGAIIVLGISDPGSYFEYCNFNMAQLRIFVGSYTNAFNITNNNFVSGGIRYGLKLPEGSNINHPFIIANNRFVSGNIDVIIENADFIINNNTFKTDFLINKMGGKINCKINDGNLTIINNTLISGQIYLAEHCFNSEINILNNVVTNHRTYGTSEPAFFWGSFTNERIESINIRNNTITNYDKAIHYYGYVRLINITHNKIANNNIGIYFNPEASNLVYTTLNISNNNFINNTPYNIYYNIVKGVDQDLSNNWWGTTNTNQIEASIYDYYDEFSLGKVLYKPYLTKPVSMDNHPPMAVAFTDQIGVVNESVNFVGSYSLDPDGDDIIYNWSFGDGTSSGWQSNSDSAHEYKIPGNYTVTLTVSDGSLIDIYLNYVLIKPKPIEKNTPPIISLPTTVNIYEDSYFNPAFDLWECTSDDRTPGYLLNFSIINDTEPRCGVSIKSNRYIIIKPEINWFGNSTIIIQVSDGEFNTTYNLTIVVIPIRDPPVADAGWDQYVKINTTVTFCGSGSYDYDGDNLSYNWSFGDGNYTGWQNKSDTTHLYNKIGIYRVKLSVTDGEFNVSDTCTVWVYNKSKSIPPTILDIPNIYIHYYSPAQSSEYSGYSYDFSYFINDLDNDRSELTTRVIPVEPNLENYIENDLNNTMKTIFKFPLELVDGKKHQLYLYVKDLNPNTPEVFRIFNITVIENAWPVELVKPFEDLSLTEDFGTIDNIINVGEYFSDRDSTTSYNVLNKNNNKIKGEIDQDLNLDLQSDDQNFSGLEEIIVHAHDSMPEQDVYAVIKIIIDPINDPPIIFEIQKQVVKVNKETMLDLKDYLYDSDTKFSKLIIESSDPDHVRILENILYIKYNETGDFNVTITVNDGEFTTLFDLLVSVIEREVEPDEDLDSDGDGIPDYWELKFKLDPNNASDAILDIDNDTLTNLEEFMMQTSPIEYDTDGDGYSDKVDEFPNDPQRFKKDIKDNESDEIDNTGYIVSLILIVLIIIVLLTTIFILKSRKQSELKLTPDDEIYKKVMHEILYDYDSIDETLPNKNIKSYLDEKLQKGQISQQTYNYMTNLVLETENIQQKEGKSEGV